jgi:hypothetical protein
MKALSKIAVVNKFQKIKLENRLCKRAFTPPFIKIPEETFDEC